MSETCRLCRAPTWVKNGVLCPPCLDDYGSSPERKAAEAEAERLLAASLVDFIARARAERQNGRGDASGT